MPQIKKILFPVDFSESSLAAARYVEAIAGQFEAEIMLLHAVGMGAHTLPEELIPGKQKELDEFLVEELKYFPTRRLCVKGDDAAAAIVEYARSWKVDLVMLPTHGLGAFRRLLLGSVTAKVLHDLSGPVWTSAHLEKPLPLEQIHCRKILCALDLAERSQKILDWAAWLASEYEAELGIVHATAGLPPAYSEWSLGQEFAKSVHQQAGQAVETLQKTAGTTAKAHIQPGTPADVVAQAVKDFGADLLVMGRHSSAGMNLRQNAYAILRDSPVPVISI